ncbi:uncharacterized protein DEA37_0014641, partial [Paragonimus westermani]
SAAALCINSGGFSDPEEAPGLSHFLEHKFALAFTNDNNRLQHFLASLAAPGSPYRKFIFDPLDELESTVREIFEAIPRRYPQDQIFTAVTVRTVCPSVLCLISVCSIKERDVLSIVWSLPSLLPYYKHWATELYADASLTSGMRNSSFCSIFEVHVHLTKLGHENIQQMERHFLSLVVDLHAAPDAMVHAVEQLHRHKLISDEQNSAMIVVLLLVLVSLLSTLSFQVCGVIFEYIQVIVDSVASETTIDEPSLTEKFSQRFTNTFQSYLEERQEMYKSSFLYNDPVEALHNCERIAEMMQIVPHKKVLSARYLIEKIDIELYIRLLKLMTHQRACIVHQSSEFGRNLGSDPSWQTESWFNIRYKSEGDHISATLYACS